MKRIAMVLAFITVIVGTVVLTLVVTDKSQSQPVAAANPVDNTELAKLKADLTVETRAHGQTKAQVKALEWESRSLREQLAAAPATAPAAVAPASAVTESEDTEEASSEGSQASGSSAKASTPSRSKQASSRSRPVAAPALSSPTTVKSIVCPSGTTPVSPTQCKYKGDVQKLPVPNGWKAEYWDGSTTQTAPGGTSITTGEATLSPAK